MYTGMQYSKGGVCHPHTLFVTSGFEMKEFD